MNKKRKSAAIPLRLRYNPEGGTAYTNEQGGLNMVQCMDSDKLHARLKKIAGQVNAIDRMIDEDVPCEDVLALINAAKSALHKAGQMVLEGHIRHCVLEGLQNGDVDDTLAKFTKTIERFANMG